MKRQNICKFPFSTILSGTLSVFCFVMESDADTMQTPVTLLHHRALLFVEGSGQLLLDGITIPLQKGSLVFCAERSEFAVQGKASASYLYIDFGGSRGEDLLRRFDIRRGHQCFDGQDGLIPLWKESLSRAQEDTIDLASESILLYTFSRLSSTVTEQSNLIGKMLELTDESFTDSDFSISKIAGILSYNPKYLSFAFKQGMNMTFSEYLRDIRIRYATSLFNSGLDSVKNVALLSGFSDPLYFSNVFKKSVGASPKEYIRMLAIEKTV